MVAHEDAPREGLGTRLPVEALLLNSEARRQWRDLHYAADAGQDRFMTLIVTHPACLAHQMGDGHPERPDRLRAIERALESEAFQMLARDIAPRAEISAIARVHPLDYIEAIRAATPTQGHTATRRRIRTLIWRYYRSLKAWRRHPFSQARWTIRMRRPAARLADRLMPGRKSICQAPAGLISILQAAASATSTLSPLQLSPILATRSRFTAPMSDFRRTIWAWRCK